ncbi:hypothetical protein FIV34_16485 [Luteibacter pinisoli]|uniref:MchC protein n=1 Tax=Luteibacter pinisoli TaxID=2589080 RepID=A0A4Y5Z825_9GAMM|nr:hypothetical protein [Luteibacter pinisoli]QDE40689.1 hypothetical protein FIV34_16485 [Luteibacter pinisoli]
MAKARVVWINARWFARHGIDTAADDARRELEQELLDAFAVSVPRGNEGDEFFATDGDSTLRADRYGSPGGANHGGSGRCGMRGFFNAKGIGPTPLAATSTDWYHQHGCMWLEEAIREAILGEVANAEFPHGAVPAVAIISVDGRVSDRLGMRVEDRRGILVRPNFVRPAHLERAFLFGHGGDEESPQYLDAVRTREAIAWFDEHATIRESAPGLVNLCSRLGEQVGFGWAHRLFHGAYVSGNMTIDGELADFGSFRALPSWHAAKVVDGAYPFGKDVYALDTVTRSLAFYLRKFSLRQHPSGSAGFDIALTAAKSAFRREALALFGITEDTESSVVNRVGEAINDYFVRQQRTFVNYFKGDHRERRPWLYEALIGLIRGASADSDEAVLIDVLAAMLPASFGAKEDASTLSRYRAAALRTLKPRQLLYRENLQRLCQYATRDVMADQAQFGESVERLIDGVVGRTRRLWPQLPADLLIVGQVVQGSAAALYCRTEGNGSSVLWIEAQGVDGVVNLFGSRVDVGAIAHHQISMAEGGLGRWRLAVDDLPLGKSLALTLAEGIVVCFPRAQITYRTVAAVGATRRNDGGFMSRRTTHDRAVADLARGELSSRSFEDGVVT